MKKKNILNAVLRHQVYIERLKTQYAEDFSSVLRKLDRNVVSIISGVRKDVGELSKKELGSLIKSLRTAQMDSLVNNEEAFLKKLSELSQFETGFETALLKESAKGTSAALGVAAPSASSAFKAALSNPLVSSGDLLEPFIKDWSARQLKGVERAVQKAWVTGSTNEQLVQAIRGTRALNFKDGLIEASARAARTVARTAVQHVSQSARRETWEKNSDLVVGYKFVAALDSRTSEQCRSLDGKTFSLGEGPTPPLHPNCRSTTVPVLDSAFDFLDKGAERSSEDGPVDADLTYYEWLKTQPESFQDDALGSTRAKLFRDGGLSPEKFADLSLGKTFEPLTLEGMRKLAPKAFEKAGV